jgi:hypothetical protein
VSEETEKPPILASNQPHRKPFLHLFLAGLALFVLSVCWHLWISWHLTKSEISRYSAGGDGRQFWDSFGPGILLMIPGILAFGFLLLGFILCLVRRSRFVGLMMLTCSVCFIGGCFSVMESHELVFGNPRVEAFSKLELRMAPLVEAIESYHRDTGNYPSELNLLLPDYLVKLPDTQMGRYTNYNYYVGERARCFFSNPWIIEMHVGHGMDFDQFYYFPLQNYPKGGPYEKIGKWAYFHE